jgi:small subunit ribosomal protein S21
MSKHQKHDSNHNVRGIKIEVYNNDVNKALRKLKKKLSDDGIFQTLRKREYYESKGTKRRLEKQAAIRRYKKNQIKQQIQRGY